MTLANKIDELVEKEENFMQLLQARESVLSLDINTQLRYVEQIVKYVHKFPVVLSSKPTKGKLGDNPLDKYYKNLNELTEFFNSSEFEGFIEAYFDSLYKAVKKEPRVELIEQVKIFYPLFDKYFDLKDDPFNSKLFRSMKSFTAYLYNLASKIHVDDAPSITESLTSREYTSGLYSGLIVQFPEESFYNDELLKRVRFSSPLSPNESKLAKVLSIINDLNTTYLYNTLDEDYKEVLNLLMLPNSNFEETFN